MSNFASRAEDVYWQRVSPSDCALLVGVPLTHDAFLSDLAMATVEDAALARGDYAFRMVSVGHSGDAEAAWKTDGLPVAELCRDLIDDACDCGLRYIGDQANRAAFLQAMRSGASVVLLVAHRRGADVLTRDIRSGLLDRLRSLVADPTSHSCMRLAQCLNGIVPTDAKAMRRALNTFIAAAPSPDDARDELDALFVSDLVPGSCVELRDGYHKDSEIAGWIPSDWKGVIELGVCHSTRLALTLKQERHDRHIITNEAEKDPSRCLREIREAVLRLALKPQHYVSLRAKIYREYSEVLGRKSACY